MIKTVYVRENTQECPSQLNQLLGRKIAILKQNCKGSRKMHSC